MTKTVFFLLFTLVWHDRLPASFIQPDAKQTNTQRDGQDQAGSNEDPASFDFHYNYSGYLVIKKHVWLYIGFTCMCINKEFERRMVFLGVKKMTERHTAENILAEYDQVLRDWNIPRSRVIKT
jgi:hypothetical protein